MNSTEQQRQKCAETSAELGSTGKRRKFTIEQVKAESLKYNKRTDFKRERKLMYDFCVRHKITDEVFAHMPKLTPSGNAKYKKADVINTAKGCKNLAEFTKKYSGMLKSAIARGYIDEVRHALGVRKKVANGHWLIKENVIKEAEKYQTKSQFKRCKQAAYHGMVKLGLSDELFPYGKRSNGYWTKDRIIETCAKFNSVSEFARLEPTAYGRSSSIEECVKLMDEMERKQNKNGYWTIERLREEAIKHETINSFRINAKGAYSAARSLGVVEDITEHMISGYKTTNCNYIWKVANFDSLYKIGVSNTAFYQTRVDAVCRSHNFKCEWVNVFETINPHNIEKRLLKFGVRPDISSGDGYTEFRILTNQELNEILEIMKNAEVNK